MTDINNKTPKEEKQLTENQLVNSSQTPEDRRARSNAISEENYELINSLPIAEIERLLEEDEESVTAENQESEEENLTATESAWAAASLDNTWPSQEEINTELEKIEAEKREK